MKKKLLLFCVVVFLPFIVAGQNNGIEKVINAIPPVKLNYIPPPENSGTTKSESNAEMMTRIMNEINGETLSKIKSTRNQYSSLGNYPETVRDGWHQVKVAQEDPQGPYFQEAKVFVSENRIKEIYFKGFERRDAVLSSLIKDGKSLAKFYTEGNFYEVYFIDYIVDPTFTSTAPEIGRVSFWTSYKFKESIHIMIDGQLQGGYLEYYFPKNSTPNCEQQGVLTLPYKAGTYRFKARADSSTLVWEGYITIKTGECSLYSLDK